MNFSTRRILIVGVAVCIVVGLVIVYAVWRESSYPAKPGASTDQNDQSLESSDPVPLSAPLSDPVSDPVLNFDVPGVTVFEYQMWQGIPYLRQTTYLNSPELEFPNSDDRIRTTVYAPGERYGAVATEQMDFPEGGWTEILTSEITDHSNAESILVNDEVLSIKAFRGSEGCLFSILLDRANWVGAGQWDPVEIPVVLYRYDPVAEPQLIQLRSWNGMSTDRRFPIIQSINEEETRVAVSLFTCWDCGPPQPETMLLNLSTLETENIGQVSFFAWDAGGRYEYKDYVLMQCSDPLSQGPCSVDPSELPMQYGTF